MADSVVTMCGNLTRDPELGYTPGGTGKATFGIAVSRRWQQNNEWQEATSFFNVVAWGKLGENLAQSAVKGTRVIVTGRLEQREYETKDGEKRTVVEVIAEELGISVKWDPAHSEKVQREGNADRQTRQSSPNPHVGHDPVYGDEEPF